MGKKTQRHGWPEAAKLCRLNENDIEMAKRLGFGPDSLIRARPDRKQRWKLPVKEWIHELHFKRFRHVIGEKPILAAPPAKIEYDPEAARRFEEEMYWEDYYERNADDSSHGRRKNTARPAAGQPQKPQQQKPAQALPDDVFFDLGITDEDVPF
jgi:hypothetical protein